MITPGLNFGLSKNIHVGTEVNVSSYTAEYKAVLDYATLNSIAAPDEFESTMIDMAMRRINTKTAWGKVIALYGLGVGNKEFSQINLKNPGTYNLTEVGTVNFTTKVGSRSSNTSSFYTTGVNPTTTQVGGVISKGAASNQACIGVRNGTTVNTYILPIAGATARYGVKSAQQSYTRPDYYPAGTLISAKNAFATIRQGGDVVLFMNGKEVARATVASGAAENREISLLAINDSTPIWHLTSTDGQYAAILSDTITTDELFDVWSTCELIRSGIKATKTPYTTTLKEWASDDVPDVYIIAGQSNALGMASFDSAPTDYNCIHPNSWFAEYDSVNFNQLNNGNDNSLLGTKTTHGVEIKLARLIDANNNKPTYFIKIARGGVAISPTAAGYSFHPLNVGSLYPNLKGIIERSLLSITQRHGSYNLKGTIWVQGEAEAGDATDAENYRTYLNTIINQLKTDLVISDLKFYCAKMNPLSVSINPFYLTVNNHLDDMATAGEIESAISSEGCVLADGQHYTSAGYDELGLRFYNAINP